MKMLTLTERAAGTIRALTSQEGVPDDAGLRMSLPEGEAGSLVLALDSPQPDDSVIEDSGAKVFLQSTAATMLEDRELDGELDDQGQASFTLARKDG
jgi:Fe-S cluster assembly iron-binding protein IscA